MTQGNEALAVARRLADPVTTASVLLWTSYAYRSVEHAGEIGARGAQLVQLAHQLGNEELYLFSSIVHAETSAMLGDLTVWDDLLAEQLRILEVIRQPYCEHEVTLRQHIRALLAGDLDTATRLLERAGEIGHAQAWGLEGLYALSTFLLRREQGLFAGLAPTLRSVVRRHPPSVLWGPGLAALYLELGMLDEAGEEFERLAADGFSAVPVDATRLLSLCLLSEVCAALDDKATAPRLLDELRPCAGKLLLFPGHGACLGPADRLLAKLAAVTGDASAGEWYEQALEMAVRLPSPLWKAHCLHDLALHLRGKHAVTAQGMLAEAARICDRHRLPRLGQRVTAEMAGRGA